MTKSIELNEWVLDELVSGTLDQQDYREVLLALEERPEMWRQCALAFLEAQALRKELVGLAQEGPLGAAPICELPEGKPAESRMELDLRSSESVDGLGAWKRPVAGQFAALAALVLLSFGIGWMLAGQSGNGIVANGIVQSGDLTAAAPSDDSPSNTLVRHDSDSRQTTVELDPGLESRAGGVDDSIWATGDSQMHWANFVDDGALAIDRKIPEPLRRLQQQGMIEIESEEAVVPVKLEDGSINLVPVQELRLKPKVFSY